MIKQIFPNCILPLFFFFIYKQPSDDALLDHFFLEAKKILGDFLAVNDKSQKMTDSACWWLTIWDNISLNKEYDVNIS